jgi:hypothetical protein
MNVWPETRDLQILLTSHKASQIHPKELRTHFKKQGDPSCRIKSLNT